MNRTSVLITAWGPDRVGFVDRITQVLVAHQANVEESRMARLAGDFAMLLLASLPNDRMEILQTDLNQLRGQGIEASLHPVRPAGEADFAGYLPCALRVTGADHEGIIQSVAHTLSELGINISDLESEVVFAPTTGTPLFNMKARILVPPALAPSSLEEQLRRVGDESGVVIRLSQEPR
jgi:glycine cleavage system transcriptional repressor